jgi:hypothetical protein
MQVHLRDDRRRPTFLQTPQLYTATFLQRRRDGTAAEHGSKSAGALWRRFAASEDLARAVEVMLMEEDKGRVGAEQCLKGW